MWPKTDPMKRDCPIYGKAARHSLPNCILACKLPDGRADPLRWSARVTLEPGFQLSLACRLLEHLFKLPGSIDATALEIAELDRVFAEQLRCDGNILRDHCAGRSEGALYIFKGPFDG